MESFGQVTASTLADAVEKRIYEYLKRNNMKSGDLLPKENELAKELNVSRHILREGLSRLRMLGLINSRKKKGMTVASPKRFAGLERIVSSGVIDMTSKQELLQMRIIIELGMADYIFYNKTDKDIKELDAIISREKTKKLSLREEDEIDIEFHAKLYAVSGNQFIIHFQKILEPFFKDIEKNIEKYRKNISVTHAEICKVLKDGSAEEFRKVMYEHLKQYMDFKK